MEYKKVPRADKNEKDASNRAKRKAQEDRGPKRVDMVNLQDPLKSGPRTGRVPGRRSSLDDLGFG